MDGHPRDHGLLRTALLPRFPRRLPDSDLRAAAATVSTGSACNTMPRPLQCEQVVENASISPVPSRLRVNCTRPSEVTSETW